MSPTSRTLKLLRDRGYRAEVVEYWNHFAKRRVDLWGWCDIVAIRPSERLAVQCTDASSMSKRVAKIEASDSLADVLAAGFRVLVIGWRKNAKGRWVHREVEVS